MLKLLEELGRAAADGLRTRFGDSVGGTALAVSRSTDPRFGELQLSAAMQLAKPLRCPPREIAQVLADALLGHPALLKVEIAGPGFVNLHLSADWIGSRVLAMRNDPALGLRNLGHGATVVIDYSSPNVAKPMHIGHIRSNNLGEALKRVLRAVGYRVIGDNHLGDWGTQFGKLIVAYRRWLDAEGWASSPVDELVRLYVKFVAEEKRERGQQADAAQHENENENDPDREDEGGPAPPLLREARAELVKLQQGDTENVALWRRFVDVSLAEFDRLYQRLGIEFDVMLGESFYNSRLAPTVEELLKRGIAEESRGAVVVFFARERDGEELPPFLIRKADGGYLYGTTDVASLLYRIETWQPARILIVTDERQQLHFRQLFATGRRLGVDCSLEHIWFGLMRLAEGTISTRDGNVINLECLLDEAERRAREVAAQHNPELTESELREVGRVVGLGAVKYNDLSRDRQSLVTFTWERALALQGNTAPYLQYAYARIRSILRKAETEGAAPGPLTALSPVERSLAVRLLWFPDAVEQVARTARPHLLSDYLFDLATAFSTFYADHPVLKAEPAIRASRLLLTDLVAATLKKGLALLNIEVLERM